MKFAQFQSTYKPIPTQVYEQTGKELETKYFRNREQFSLLRQAMANSKVEDRNIGHLAKATADVEGVIDEVNGKWHYANNALFAAKDRLVTDKALNASIEDYAKSQAAKQAEQKRFEEGKIDQDALNAFYTNDKRYNNKAIEVDENGQTINRWATPAPPPKVDTEKKVLEIVDQLTKHKDTLDVVYSANPALKGFVDQHIVSGKSPDVIAAAVRDWLRTTPEVKQYYNYINDAKVFNAVTERGADGQYLTDELGQFIQKDITPADFRAIGIQVADDWTTPSNVIIKKGKDNILRTQPIEGLSSDFRQTGAYKELIENGLDDKQAIQELYKNSLTDLQLENIVNFSRKFGYAQDDIRTLEDKAYWWEMEARKKKEEQANINGAYEGQAPLVLSTYTPEASKKTINELNKRLEAYKPGDPEYNKINVQIENIKAQESMLRRAYLDSPAGMKETNGVWEEFMKYIPKDQQSYYKQDAVKQEIIEYLTGQREDLTINVPTKQITANIQGGIDRLGIQGVKERVTAMPRFNFEDRFTKAIQNGTFTPTFKTKIFHDKDGKPSPLMENTAKHVLTNGQEWVIPSSLNEQGEPMTVADWYAQSGIDPDKYDVTIEFGDNLDHVGYDVLRFYPKNKDVKELPPDKAMKLIQPNADNRDAILMDRAKMIAANRSEDDAESEAYINTTMSGVLFGHYFEPIKNSLAINNAVNTGFSFDDFQPQRLSQIPASYTDSEKTIEAQISVGTIGTYNGQPVQGFILNQIDPNTGAVSRMITSGRTLQEVQNKYYQEYLKQ